MDGKRNPQPLIGASELTPLVTSQHTGEEVIVGQIYE